MQAADYIDKLKLTVKSQNVLIDELRAEIKTLKMSIEDAMVLAQEPYKDLIPQYCPCGAMLTEEERLIPNGKPNRCSNCMIRKVCNHCSRWFGLNLDSNPFKVDVCDDCIDMDREMKADEEASLHEDMDEMDHYYHADSDRNLEKYEGPPDPDINF